MVLTKARGGRRGQSRILWPLAPQYRHNPSVKRLRLSVDDTERGQFAWVLEGHWSLVGEWEEWQWLPMIPLSMTEGGWNSEWLVE